MDSVFLAASADEALVMLEITRPDLILTDVEMPGMSGFELARRIRKMPQAPRVVIMSLSNSPEYGEQARLAGADVFVDKSEIYDALNSYLQAAFGADPMPHAARGP